MAEYSGPSSSNNFLHSIPHCSFSHGCHWLPFAEDTDAMVQWHHGGAAHTWAEALALIAGVPLVVYLLYLLIDSVYRCARHCCCPAASNIDPHDSFLPPSSRVANYGASSSAAIFPPAEIVHSSKRGGVAGKISDYSQHNSPRLGAQQDPSNPFNQSTRLISVAHLPLEEHDLAEAEIVRPKDLDAGYDTRMLAALILSVAAITLLAVSIVMSERYNSRWQEVRTDVTQTSAYFQNTMQFGGVGQVQTDCGNFQQTLQGLLAAGATSRQPLTNDTKSKISQLSNAYGMLSVQIEPFSDVIARQSDRLSDALDWMDRLERVRQDATYSIVAVALGWVVVVMVIYTYYRRRPGLALFASSFFALTIFAVCWLWAFELAASVGVSDVCQAPLAYGSSFLNSSNVIDEAGSGYGPHEAAVAQFYVDCPADAAPTDNPLQSDLQLMLDALDSPSVRDGLSDLVNYINTERGDLEQFAYTLTSLNASTYGDVAQLEASLDCRQVHSFVVHAAEHVCHPITEALWTATCLQFFACLCLVLVRALVWMRKKRTSTHDDVDDLAIGGSRASSPHPNPSFGAPSHGFATSGSGSANFSSSFNTAPNSRYSAL